MKLLFFINHVTILTAALGALQQVQAQGFVPVNVVGISDPSLANCYRNVNASGDRILIHRIKNQWGDTYADTPQTCAYWAGIQGWTYFGVENGGECWGGDVNVDIRSAISATNCNSPCSNWGSGNLDNSQTKCGGNQAINIFQITYAEYSYVGCFSDVESNRDLPHKLVDYANGNINGNGIYYLNAPACAYRAQRAGYKYFGLQAGGSCWAGNTYGRVGSSQDCARENCPKQAPAASAFNSNDKCGAVNTNAVYKLKTINNQNSGSLFVGCYRDNVVIRDLPAPIGVFSIPPSGLAFVDYQSCSFVAKKYGYAFFGLQNGTECWGGNSVGRYGKLDLTQCDSLCDVASPGENCGGRAANLVYAIQPPTISCNVNSYFDATKSVCTSCPDNQYSNGGAIWSCTTCWGGGGSRAAGTCQPVPTTDPDAAHDDNDNDDKMGESPSQSPVSVSSSSNHINVGVIVGSSIGGAIGLWLLTGIVYLFYRRVCGHGHVHVHVHGQENMCTTNDGNYIKHVNGNGNYNGQVHVCPQPI